MSNLVEHAKREFLALGYKPVSECEDDPNKWIQENVIELLEVFAKQGHSGSSAPFCIEYFKKLADFKPLTPIKCTDDEWTDTGHCFQNKRLFSVFKDSKDGNPYYLHAISWRTEKGTCWNGTSVDSKGNIIKSSQFIKLPFTPKTFYIDIIETEWADKEETVKKKGGGWWTSVIKDEEQLKPAMEYYHFQDLANKKKED